MVRNSGETILTLFEWGALGELVGGVAIIVSLIYVGLQVKQNTDTLRLSTARNTTADLADINLLPAQNKDFADIFFRGVQDIESLEGPDRATMYGYFHKFYRTYENAHYQFSRGALEADLFRGITNQNIMLTSMPGAQRYWRERKTWYNEEFQAYVDNELRNPDREKYKLAGA